ncbi:MAG: hypothetical protein JOZ38_07920 [Candidatus Eremiobacteraeota bacterium]|nr:hypothetical protein [Candidatus Eremiobacteraeota bacterium]
MLPAVVSDIVQQTTRAESGVATAQYARTFDVHAGSAKRHDSLTFVGLYQNGDLVSVHITSDMLGGKSATPEQLAQAQSQYEHPQPADVFRAPWDARYTADYTYRVASATTIEFTSLVKDTAHGSGSFTIDAQNNVLTYQYTMSANWKYATLGTVSGQRAEVLPGYWATTHEVEQDTGRYGPVPGGATTDIVQSSFRKFANVTDAQRAMSAP